MFNGKKKKHPCTLIKPLAQSSRNINSSLTKTNYPSTSSENGYCNSILTNTNDNVTHLQDELQTKKAFINELKAINLSYKNETTHQRTLINTILKGAENQTSNPFALNQDQLDNLQETSYINSLNRKIRDLTLQLTNQRTEMIQLKDAYGINCSYSNNSNEMGALRHENHSVKYQLLDINRKYRDMSDEHRALTEKMKKAKKCLKLIKDKEIFSKTSIGSKDNSLRNLFNCYANAKQNIRVIAMPTDRLPSKNESYFLRKKAETNITNGMDFSSFKATNKNESKDLKLKCIRKNILYQEALVKYNNVIKQKNKIEKELNNANDAIDKLAKVNEELKKALSNKCSIVECYKNQSDSNNNQIEKLKHINDELLQPKVNKIQCLVCDVHYLHRPVKMTINKWSCKLVINTNETITFANEQNELPKEDYTTKQLEKYCSDLKPVAIYNYQYINNEILNQEKPPLQLNKMIFLSKTSNKESKETEIVRNKKEIINSTETIENRMKKNYIRNQSRKNKKVTMQCEDDKKNSHNQPELDDKANKEDNNQIQELSSQIKELKEEKDHLTAKYQSLKKEKEYITSQNKSLETENNQLTSKYQTLKEENNQLTLQYQSLETEKEQLTSKNQSLETEKEHLTSKNQSLETEKEHLTSKNQSLETEKVNFASQYQSLEAEVEKIKEDNLLLQTENEKRREAFRQLESERKAISSQCASTQIELNALKVKYKSIQKENQEVVKEIEGLRRSHFIENTHHPDHIHSEIKGNEKEALFNTELNLLNYELSKEKSIKAENSNEIEKQIEFHIQSLSNMNIECNNKYDLKQYSKALTFSRKTNHSLIKHIQTSTLDCFPSDQKTSTNECNIQLLDDYLKEYEAQLNDEMIKSNVLKKIAMQEQAKYRKIRSKYKQAKESLQERKKSFNTTNSKQISNNSISSLSIFEVKKNQDDNIENEDKRSYEVISEKSSFNSFSIQAKDKRKKTGQFIHDDALAHNLCLEDSKKSKKSQEDAKTEEMQNKNDNIEHSRQNHRYLSFKAQNDFNNDD